jgi:hypothetical protein
VLVVAIAGAVGLKVFIGSSQTFKTNLRQSIDNRAQLNLYEDFREGLDSWESGRTIARSWSYDPSGLVIPGDLSLYKPSMNLMDYDVETWAEIVTKGFGLVVRAAGPRTYHAVKFMTQGSGATSSIAAERYTLIDGATSARTNIRYPIPIRKDELCRIRLQVHGDSFTLYAQGQVIDNWSDQRLNSGGVGLFCGAGERARIAWVRVSHQTDLTGKFCSLVSWLSPTILRE